MKSIKVGEVKIVCIIFILKYQLKKLKKVVFTCLAFGLSTAER